MTTLEILHWNDVHARYDRLARAAAMARRIKAEADHPVLLLDGGDIEGSATYRVSGTDVEVSSYGGLLADNSPDTEVFVPQIMPELLEAYLVDT